LEAFKQIWLNKSAIACVAGTALRSFAALVVVYAVSFYRISFSIPATTANIFASAAVAGGILGAVGGGRLINRFGRKPLAIVTLIVSGSFAGLFTFVPNVWVSVAFWAVSATFAAMAATSLNNLVLEQVPGFRASMMSVNHVFNNVGTIIAIAIGGIVLNFYSNNFQLLMTILGVAGISEGMILILLAKDPCQPV
jgi:MFS family permease